MKTEPTIEQVGPQNFVIKIERPDPNKIYPCPEFFKTLDDAVRKALRNNICIYVEGIVVDGRDEKNLKIKVDKDYCSEAFDAIVKHAEKYTKLWIASTVRGAA
ncbi:MAG TPA: hypothetical protein VFF64_24435 [Candidatus Eremiobacteraceae bacterium]|nr:hypothetical protein [Candidatus Eremiobacteraceae bacterium]